ESGASYLSWACASVTSCTMSPRTTPKRSSSYRHSLMTFSWVGASKACPIGCSAQLLRPEDVLEQPLPFLLLVPGEDSGNDFSILQPLAHLGGIDRTFVEGRQTATLGHELLGRRHEDEVRARQGGLGNGPRRTDADRAEQQRDRIERPEIDGRAANLPVDGKRRVIVEREPI